MLNVLILGSFVIFSIDTSGQKVAACIYLVCRYILVSAFNQVTQITDDDITNESALEMKILVAVFAILVAEYGEASYDPEGSNLLIIFG